MSYIIDKNNTNVLNIGIFIGGKKNFNFLGSVNYFLYLYQMERINYDGHVFGRLTVLRDGEGHREPSGKLQRTVICKCECGTEKQIVLKDLKRGDTKSCGCLNREQKLNIKEGDIFGYWSIVNEVSPYKDNQGNTMRKFKVKCTCGKEKEITLNSLKQGKSSSCGCQIDRTGKKGARVDSTTKIPPIDFDKINLRKLGDWKVIEEISATRNEKNEIERTVKLQCKCGYTKVCRYVNIGVSKSCSTCTFKNRLESIPIEEREIRKNLRHRYKGIKLRCYNKNNKSYPSYGGRGIVMSDEWFNSFDLFYNWSINNGFKRELEFDRIDNNKGYSSDNIRFVTKKENNRNQRTTKLSLEIAREIRSLENPVVKDLALKYDCSTTIILMTLKNKIWVE